MSNPVLEAIHSRRSVRAYTDAPVTDAQFAALCDAALAAPSASNRQPWQVIAVKNRALVLEVEKAVIDYYVEQNDAAMVERNQSRGNKVFYDAPLVFFIPIADGVFSPVDAGILSENLALAAKGLGLDSVILGMPRAAFLGSKADALKAKLKFPEGYEFAIAVAVGTAAQGGAPHEKNPARLTVIE